MPKETLADVIGRNIVDPRCDDCGAPILRPAPLDFGPHQCRSCAGISQIKWDQQLTDFVSQERPRNRRVHVVKLPEGMLRK